MEIAVFWFLGFVAGLIREQKWWRMREQLVVRWDFALFANGGHKISVLGFVVVDGVMKVSSICRRWNMNTRGSFAMVFVVAQAWTKMNIARARQGA